MICGDLNGKEIEKRMDICIHITNSFCSTAEANNIVKINFTIKINLKKVQMINARDSVEKREPFYSVNENIICTATMESNMKASLKTKSRPTTWSSKPSTGHVSGENLNSKR